MSALLSLFHSQWKGVAFKVEMQLHPSQKSQNTFLTTLESTEMVGDKDTSYYTSLTWDGTEDKRSNQPDAAVMRPSVCIP